MISMQTKLVECVPNFSEGKNKNVIDKIADAIRSTSECILLDVDPGISTNRTVFTFVGSPSAVVEGAVNAAKVAYNLIDMRQHKGEHPRLGALDVCPFIPVRNVSIEECIECSHLFARRLSTEVGDGIPVYLYAYSQDNVDRKSMPQIRVGEYEKLAEKLKDPSWAPDYGPAKFVPSWGATVTGCRKFLVAYNINMLSTKEQAHRIALNIREQGRDKAHPGRLKHVQAIGWWLEEGNMAQVSVNILDMDVTPVHTVYEEVVKDAKELNLPVVGSEVVGLIPLQTMLVAANHYMQKEDLFILDETQKIKLVIDRLGLNSLNTFNPKEKIIEYILDDGSHGRLQDLSVYDFVHKVGGRCPAPGGGSVAALLGSLGAGLGSMVGLLTYGNRRFEKLDGEMRQLLPPHYATMKNLLPMIDSDTQAFTDFMNACKLPSESPEEKELKQVAVAAAIKNCIEVPLYVARNINSLWPYMVDLAKVGNINTKSDLQVAARCLEAATWGAYHNVMVNVENCEDEDLKTEVVDEVTEYADTATERRDEVLAILKSRE